MNGIRIRGWWRPAGAVAIALLTAVGSAAGQQPAPELTLTLEEALRLAAEHSPRLTQAAGAVQSARAAERTAAGSFLPTLSLSTGGSLAGSEQRAPTGGSISQTSDSYSLGLSSGVDLYTGGRRGAERTQARAETASADAALVVQRYATVLETKRAFFDLLRASELHRVARSRVERAERALATANERQRVGSATRSDVLRSQLELSRARQAVLESENQRRTGAFALGRLVGSEVPVGARGEGSLDPTALTLSHGQIVELAVGEAPAVRTALATVRSSAAGIGVARAQYLPSVRLTGGYNFANQDPALWNGNTNWNFGLSLSFPVFNGFGRDESAQRARIQVAVATAELEDARRAARADAERLLGSLALAEQSIAIATESVRVAEEDLRVQQDRYRLGASTILDQIQSQESLVQAETDLVTARFDYQIARAELESRLGRDL